jgi:AcrR family transcriptional regulator
VSRSRSQTDASAPARTDPRLDRTRKAVFQAVRELLVEEGWEAVTQNEVALRSGVGRSTVYGHWPDRNSLVLDAWDLELDYARNVALSRDLRSNLLAAMEAIRYSMIDRQGARFLIAMIARAEWDLDVQPIKKDLVERSITTLRAILIDAIARNALPSDEDPDLAIDHLCGPIVMRRLVTDQPLERPLIERLVDDYLTLARHRGEKHRG